MKHGGTTEAGTPHQGWPQFSAPPQGHTTPGAGAGQYGMPPFPPPRRVLPPGYNPDYNVLAIVAFASVLFVWPLAIPLAHIARGQIRRTREQGDILAVAALALGYGWLAMVGLLVISLAWVM